MDKKVKDLFKDIEVDIDEETGDVSLCVMDEWYGLEEALDVLQDAVLLIIKNNGDTSQKKG